MNKPTMTLAAVVAAALLAGCGVSTSTTTSGSASHSQKTTKHDSLAAKKARQSELISSARALASRPPTDLIIDGANASSLSQKAYRDYAEQGGAEAVTIKGDNTSTSFADLCSGRVDIVDSSTAISKTESKACRAVGIEPVQIQVASDAAVLATENETDVGADCLTMPQVRAIFRAGSPVDNWSQLGFDAVRLAVAGPNPADSAFSFFAQSLVGQSATTLEDFRYNYKPKATEAAIREFVVGTAAEGELATERLSTDQSYVTNAKAYILGQQDTLRGALKAIRSDLRYKKTAALARDTSHKRNALRLLKRFDRQLAAAQKKVAGDLSIQKQAEKVVGHLGVFHYDYYSLYEQQLRPLEVTASATHENCVFPSQATITAGTYPLSHRLLLTFSLQELRRNDGLRGFLLSYLKNANTLASKLSMVPLPPNVLTQERAWLEGKDVNTSTTTGQATTTTPTTTTSTSTEENSMSGTGSGGTEPSGEKVTGGTSTTSTTGQTTSSSIPSGVH